MLARGKARTNLISILLMAFCAWLITSSVAFAVPSLSPDGKTCTPCHQDNIQSPQPPADSSGQSAKPAPAPAKPAPAPQPPTESGQKPSSSAGGKGTVKQAAPAPASQVTVYLERNGRRVEVAGTVKAGIVFVPLRKVAEFLGASLEWNEKKKQVTFSWGGTSVVLTPGAKQVYVDGKAAAWSAAAELERGRTWVPLRPLATVLGATITAKDGWKEILVVFPAPKEQARVFIQATNGR